MEMKSTAPYPPPPPPPPVPPPPYNAAMPYPEPQPSLYGYPHSATSWTPNYPVAPPTTEIGFRDVYVVEPNREPTPVVVVQKDRSKRCCLSSFISLLISIIIIIVLLKVILHIW